MKFRKNPSNDSESVGLNTEEKIRIFRSLFRGRDDVYGSGKGQCVRKRLTDQVILRHLQGKQRIGIYPLLRDSSIWFGTVDIDQRDLEAVASYLDTAHSYGITAYLEASKSKGFHLWHFFAEAVPASKARGLIEFLIPEAGLSEKTEVFPKQSQLYSSESVGNYINAPLFGKDVENGNTVFLGADFAPYGNQWEFLASVEKMTREQLEEVMESNGIPGDMQVSEKTREETFDSDDEYGDMLPCVRLMMQGVSQGCRDEVAFCLAKHWRVEKKLPEEATLPILREWNRKNSPPLDDKVILAKVKSAYEGKDGSGYTSFGCDNDLIEPFCDKENCPVLKKHQNSKGKDDSSYFNGKAFVPPRLGDELMDEYSFLYAGQQLYVYMNGVYVPMGEDFIRRKCREKLQEHSRINRINEVIAHIEDLSRVDNDDLNTYRGLINLENGMLDWRTAELLPHSGKYRSTTRIPVVYDPAKGCPKIEQFLSTTLPKDCIDLAYELLGYCLIPDTQFQKAFMLVGGGRNGKSTFLNVLDSFVGAGNVSKIPIQELSDNRFKRADLYGKLANIFADLDDRSLRNTSYFKAIVGGDPIDGERKNRDPFYFRPFSRLVYSANEIPRSRDRSIAYYRRWCIIRFPNQFTGKTEKKGLSDTLVKPEEMSGVLNHALGGLRRLFENQEFSESETVNRELEEYKKANDTVIAFLSEECALDAEGRIARTQLYDTYMQYCEAEGYSKPVSRHVCYNRVKAQGVSEHKGNGTIYFTGIRLIEA